MRNHSPTTSTNADSFRRLEVITGVGRRRRWSGRGEGADRGREPRPGDDLLGGGPALRAAREPALRLAAAAATERIVGRDGRGPAFVPVLLAEDSAAPAEAAGRMEIALGPAVVRVGADVDAAALRRVLEVVRGLA